MKTMPLPDIIKRIADLNGCSEATAAMFVAEFTDILTKALTESGNATIKGLGTFQRIESGNDITVEFAPDGSLASAVNAPFSMFDPVELDDEITAEMLETAATNDVTPNVNETEATLPQQAADCNTAASCHPETAEDNDAPNNRKIESLPPDIPPIPAKHIPTPITYNEPQKPYETDPAPVSPLQTHHPTTTATATETVTKDVAHEKIIEKERVVEVVGKHHNLHLVITALIALLTGVIIGCFSSDLLNLTNVKNVNISADDVQVYHRNPTTPAPVPVGTEPLDTIAEEDTLNLHPTATVSRTDASGLHKEIEAEKIVTDTVKSNRFLTTMAREHYGKKIFWVYIYEENSAKLSDPDHIEANTVVVIPPAEKYGIKAGDEASEADAQRRAIEIINRW